MTRSDIHSLHVHRGDHDEVTPAREQEFRQALAGAPMGTESDTRMIEPKTSIQKGPNQALQTTSVTRSEFGKVSDSDRQRRGV